MQNVKPCARHPEREAVKTCSVCRRAYCSECITLIDGMNYCPDPACRKEILAGVKMKLASVRGGAVYDDRKSSGFIKRNAAALIILGVLNLLFSYAGCNRTDINTDELKAAAEMMKGYTGESPLAGEGFSAMAEEISLMTETMDDMSVVWDLLSVLAILSGAGLLFRKRIAKLGASLVLFAVMIFTVYFSYINHVLMKRVSELLTADPLMSSVSGGFSLISIMTLVFALATILYCAYLLYRLNTSPVSEAFS